MTPDVRVTERVTVEWRGEFKSYRGEVYGRYFATKDALDAHARGIERPDLMDGRGKCIAIERITTTERVERFPVPEETGQ